MHTRQALGTTTILACVLCASGTSAGEREFPLEDFDSIGVGTGIEAEVVCGDEDRVVLESSRDRLDSVLVRVRNGRLGIRRSFSFFDWFDHHHHDDVFATVTTKGTIREFDLSTGAVIRVDDCAVADDHVDVEVSTGANARIAGRTESLDLRVGTGANFNTGRYRDELSVTTARVKLSTGGTAGLCESERVSGDASTGARIHLSRSTDADLDLSTGAEITRFGC